MLVQKWMLPTLNELLDGKFDQKSPHGDTLRLSSSPLETQAQQEWSAAVSATEEFLLKIIDTTGDRTPSPQGTVFAVSSPLWSNQTLLNCLPTWVFVAPQRAESSPQLPPANLSISSQIATFQQLPLLLDDPLSEEQFCLVLTAKFSLLLVLGVDNHGNQAFRFSFEPEEVTKVWQLLRSRLLLANPQLAINKLDALVEKFTPIAPDYRLVTDFSHLLLKHSQAKATKDEHLTAPKNSHRSDIELLQAFAHEVRTPLTTIRTLTRLILKRKDLAPEVKKRLEVIDSECTEQVNRMELIFKAAELVENAMTNTVGLTAMSLAQVLQQSIPRWQQQAHRRNLTLDVILPQQMPTVVSDPTILDQVLTGLIENFTRNLTAGSHIQVQVIPAGNQLKLQLLHQSFAGEGDKSVPPPYIAPTVKSLGQLLMFQPETGNISLNLNATKYLFQAIGGKLIVRQRPHQGEVLTIFLPMDLNHPPLYQPSC
ncbi:sensor histidine kinase [Synechocystis sp. PCC 7509]|uniref:sensor histidine kinase n=1 Tax=Synechocystis sp. PCC 7509 TaxID=927677 RepID=UPI0002ABB26B|nr:HAMP domain-containing sensor histidine kinase [Synechocystis sp. PCC 7509]